MLGNRNKINICSTLARRKPKDSLAKELQVQNINNCNSIHQRSRTTEKETQQLTKGFAIVGLDVINISYVLLSTSVPARQYAIQQQFLISTINNNQQQFGRDGTLIPHHRKAQAVGSNFMKKFFKIKTDINHRETFTQFNFWN